MQVAILAVLSLIAVLILSLLWTNRSPTPSTKPTPTSDVSESSTTLTTISQMFVDLQRETRELVVTLMQGREQPGPTTPRETTLIESEKQSVSDFDSGPTSPGIEEVERREAEEALQEALLRERQHWQERMKELERVEQERSAILESLEQSSPGPWNGNQGIPDMLPHDQM
jgi:hypothetical protein